MLQFKNFTKTLAFTNCKHICSKNFKKIPMKLSVLLGFFERVSSNKEDKLKRKINTRKNVAVMLEKDCGSHQNF